MNRLTCASLICGLLFASLAVGCGGPKAPPVVTETTAAVKGKVTLKGRPVANGSIVLYSLTNGNTVEAPLDGKGEFTLTEKIPSVEYTVFFRGRDGNPHQQVPEVFQSETSSTYKVTVAPGDNDLVVALE